MKKYIIPVLALLAAAVTGCKEKHPSQDQITGEPVQAESSLPQVISQEGNKASCVYLTNDQSGIPYISWVEIDSVEQKHFFFAKFDEEKKGFAEKQAIPMAQNASIHEEGMPKLAIKGNGDLFALYETSTPREGERFGLGDLRYLQSADGGKTWSEPQSVAPEDLAANRSSGFSNLRRLTDGEIGIAWLGTGASETEGRPVKFARTKPDGTLDQSRVVDPENCQCCRTAVTAAENGTVYVAYRNLLPGSIRDISLAVSNDNGKSFKKPVSFSDDQWVVEGCPHNGPSLTAWGSQLNATWFTNAEKHQGVNYAVLDAEGKVIKHWNISAKGQFIQNDFLSDGTPVLAYNESYDEDGVYYSRIMAAKLKDNSVYKREITPAHANASYPMLVGFNEHQLLVGWSGDGKVSYRIIDTNHIENPEFTSTSGWFVAE